MQFAFNGTLNEFKNTITKKAVLLHKDIVVYHPAPDVLHIGFHRLGHSGGRFFIANITEENENLILDGEIKNLTSRIPSADTRSTFQKIRETLFGLVIVYVFLALIPWIIWSVFEIPHPWISFLIPAIIILLLQIPPLFHRGQKSFDAEDSSFLLFMTMVTSRKITIPVNSQELYKMLANSQGLHSLPQIKDDVITWELYDGVCIEASISEYDTIIDIVQNNAFHDSYTHWHPDLEEMYEELYKLGKAGNILVLRKTLFGIETYYIGEPDKYRFPAKKKWHWGRLIYLSQK